MRQFIEFVPIALFVAVYFTTRDIYLATAILMLGMCIQVGFEYYQDKALSKRTIVVFFVVILAGTATLFSRMRLLLNGNPQSLTGYSALH
jgi:intracellular septation protein